MKIAVIGASSFSGKVFCKRAREHGAHVLELSRPDFNLGGPLPMAKAIIDGECRVVVNFAALNMVAESWQHYHDYYRINVIGVARLADALKSWPGLLRFVQVSTPEVYGDTTAYCDELHPMRPSTPYAVSRAAADMHLAALHKAFGFPVCYTRTVNVYGPGQQVYRIIPKTVLSILRGRKLKLHGGGFSQRSFVHIDDVAEGTLRVALDGDVGEAYHMSTHRMTSIRDLVRKVCGLMKVDFEQHVEDDIERPGKDMAYKLADSKIRNRLGWTEHVPFDEGLAATVGWFSDQNPQIGASLEYEHKA